MSRASSTSHLPPELAVLCLNFLAIRDLVAAMAVCSSWRAIGQTVPAFWRDIELNSSSAGALALFQYRLAAKPHAPVSVTVTLYHRSSCNVVADVVLPLLAEHIPRCTELHLHVHLNIDIAVYASLSSHPALLLETLTLALYGERRERWLASPLPPTIFAYTAPRLRSIYIRAVNIRTGLPAAFAGVTTATFDNGRMSQLAIHLESISTHLPVLTDLTVIGTSCPYVGSIEFMPAIQRLLARLDVMRILMRDGIPAGLLYWQGLSSMRHIYTTDTTARSLAKLMPHVWSHVYLDARVPERGSDQETDRYVLRYVSLRTGICRSLAGTLPPHIESPNNDLPVLPGLSVLHDRLYRLETSAHFWVKLASRFTIPPLPACTEVQVTLSRHITLAEMSSVPLQLHCPYLRAVEVTSPDAVRRCTFGDISNLIVSLFTRVETRVHVALRSVELSEESAEVVDWIDIARS
ncbi:hypothetical protein EXIGLDRAFT_782701 [Exidia glandulosa HHB12029]|uniref:F-box domain-containing protein n=1 Tax=Exidia glandulosa HHB12029 TaxID=1314781 RepID=A0A166NHR9_EXIGL|nr:hypothetical protein EXIGLDRAFT_782701 [Exidia glandulosa HHB12029]